MSIASAIKSSTAEDLADLSAYIVSECQMVSQDADGNIVDLKPEDVIKAIQAWAYMHLYDRAQGD